MPTTATYDSNKQTITTGEKKKKKRKRTAIKKARPPFKTKSAKNPKAKTVAKTNNTTSSPVRLKQDIFVLELAVSSRNKDEIYESGQYEVPLTRSELHRLAKNSLVRNFPNFSAE